MVGHTGIMAAAVKAVDTIDECLGRLIAAHGQGGRLHAAHRRSRQYRDDEGSRNRRALYRAHHLRCADRGAMARPKARKLENGRLADIAPTMLALMGLAQPEVMTGHSLLAGAPRKRRTPEPAAKYFLAAGGAAVRRSALARGNAALQVAVTPHPRPALKSRCAAPRTADGSQPCLAGGKPCRPALQPAAAGRAQCRTGQEPSRGGRRQGAKARRWPPRPRRCARN